MQQSPQTHPPRPTIVHSPHMSDPSATPASASAEIAAEDLSYLSILSGFGCVVPDEIAESSLPANAISALKHRRSHLRLAHRPSVLRDSFLSSKEPTPRASLQLTRDGESGERRARRSSSYGRLKSARNSGTVRRISSAPKLKGLREHSALGDGHEAAGVPPWTVGDDSVSDKEVEGSKTPLPRARPAQQGPPTRRRPSAKSIEERYLANRSDSSNERVVHDDLRWFARCVVGSTADSFISSTISRANSTDSESPSSQSQPTPTKQKPGPASSSSASPAKFGSVVEGLLDGEKQARPSPEKLNGPGKKVSNRWAKALEKTKGLRGFRKS
ncbi:hypothetical protein FN846DRAFT_1019233 [Sphaerosporella brunnea]|uniref:Uncharacterized protein n=1 Tax=Sphaerosporella brunnea TaxID=1250544 RepID=A0A5J5F650_9PEZI|nr:hypothetical protein FN846DRAFT_1019233 [Sphaerosporella brunnea]